MLLVFYRYRRLKQVRRLLCPHITVKLISSFVLSLQFRPSWPVYRSRQSFHCRESRMQQYRWSSRLIHLITSSSLASDKAAIDVQAFSLNAPRRWGGGQRVVVPGISSHGCKRRNTNASLTDRITSADSSPRIAGNVVASLLREHYDDGDVFVTKSVLSNVIQSGSLMLSAS